LSVYIHHLLFDVQTFENKDKVAVGIKESLRAAMEKYGYVIVNALVTEIEPDAKVKNAMNQINASVRERAALNEKAEAKKIKLVKAAEAEAESKYLSGHGVARQRKAIVDGLKNSIQEFQQIKGSTPKDVIDLLLLTQYFDMIKDVGSYGGCETIFTAAESGEGGIRSGMMQAMAR